MAKFQEEKTQRKYEQMLRKEEEESVKLLSQKYKLSYVNLSAFSIDVDALKIIPEDKSRFGELAIFQATAKRLKVAVRNPEKEETRAILKRLEEDGYQIELYLASRHSLERAWTAYRRAAGKHEITVGAIDVSPQKLEEFQKALKGFEHIKEEIEARFGAKTTEALEVIIAGALVLDASDIHIEPQEEKVRLRYRIDGALYDVTELPMRLYTLLLSRIKLVSDLKLNIKDRAQDGRFTIKTGGVDVEVRTSTLPGPKGENVVMRILNPKAIQIEFEDLGMQPWIVEAVEKELKKPNGMILTTGPTGSGKTTTLYAFLRKVHSPTIKIITLEDPIEYHLKGIEQTQVAPERGYDFANGLRAIVRQDPDVILVGEIRDLETAETAMHASLTGHLVFSTLHTNSAAGTVPRLIDLGVKPAIIAPAINLSMAQRLVRRLCRSCRVPVEISAKEKNEIENELKNFPRGVPVPSQEQWTIFKASEKGCEACNNLGYKGRVGVYEIILIDDAVERLILKEPSEYEIKKEAARQGQINMRQDGILKVLAGITDFEELERVVGT
jgi:type II secretory ATPase GspE/PulE/Tfp pilus assembly ATPase PilB-like protein